MVKIKKFVIVLKNLIKNILLWLEKIIESIQKLIPEKYKYIYIIILWVILLIQGFITEWRLIRFCIIILIIAMYKKLHKQVEKINVKDSYIPWLLKIYKYKNPLIWLILEIELKISYFMYILTKKNIKLKYIDIIYNLTTLKALKIILTKFYIILLDWKKYTIYEILFKRIYGMILSILIFTNIIQLVLSILYKIWPNWFLWIYIFLIILSYTIKSSSIDTIEYLRKESNFLWLILIKKNEKIINIATQDLKILLGVLFIKDKLNYENYLKYLLLSWKENQKLIYYKPSYMYCYEIQNIYFETNYIFYKNAKLKKEMLNIDDMDLINICEYNILIYKLVIFYIWDFEKVLSITETLIKIEKKNPDWLEDSWYIYEYNIRELKKIYHEKIQNVELNKFWDLIENYDFYEKMHNYFYDYNFLNSKNYNRLLNLKIDYEVYDKYLEQENLNDEDYEIQKTQQLIKHLEELRKEWKLENKLQPKYYNIFKDIDNIKNKINERY